MSIASINIQTAKATSKAHISRDKNHKITYLLDPDSKKNEYKSFLDSEKYLEAAKVAAKKLTGRKMQQKAIEHFIQEAVLNLENFHTVADVEKVFLELKKEFGGFKVFEIAIHRDEGYFYNLKEELEYRPQRDIFFNDQDKKFYLDSSFKNEADLNQFEKRYNYHAHVLFSKFDMTTGKNPRLKKSDMSKIQTITAKALGMQRGELFSKAKRMSHWQLKKGHDLKRDEKQKEQKKSLAKQKDLKNEISNLRAELQKLGAVRADYAKLEQVNKELKKEIQEKNLTVYELRQKMTLWRHEETNWENGKKYKDLYAESNEENQKLKKELETLKNVQTEPKRYENTKKEQETVLEPLTNEIELLSNEFQLQLSDSFLKVAAVHSVDLLLEKNTKLVEKKSFLYTETKEELDLKSFISDLKTVEAEHQSNYRKFEKIINSLKNVLKKVKSLFKNPFENKEKTEQEKKVDLIQKIKSSREENPRRGFRR